MSVSVLRVRKPGCHGPRGAVTRVVFTQQHNPECVDTTQGAPPGGGTPSGPGKLSTRGGALKCNWAFWGCPVTPAPIFSFTNNDDQIVEK